jgi:hypothetical protein
MYEMQNECYFIHKESSYDIFHPRNNRVVKEKGPMRELMVIPRK